MEKIFSNKKLAYVLIGILLVLQLTQSIANWCGGGFNGGSLVLCILLFGLLALIGVGIAKENKLLTIVSGVSVFSVLIYTLISSYTGIFHSWIDGKYSVGVLMVSVFGCIGALLLIGSLILVILRACKIRKNLTTINSVFSLIAVLMFLLVIITSFATGRASDPAFSASLKLYYLTHDFFVMIFALLIPCVWHQVEAIKG